MVCFEAGRGLLGESRDVEGVGFHTVFISQTDSRDDVS